MLVTPRTWRLSPDEWRCSFTGCVAHNHTTRIDLYGHPRIRLGVLPIHHWHMTRAATPASPEAAMRRRQPRPADGGRRRFLGSVADPAAGASAAPRFPSNDRGLWASMAGKTVGAKSPQGPAAAPARTSVLESAPVHRMAVRCPNKGAPRMDDPLLAQLGGRLVGRFAGNDQIKANAARIFKRRGVTSFKTV